MNEVRPLRYILLYIYVNVYEGSDWLVESALPALIKLAISKITI